MYQKTSFHCLFNMAPKIIILTFLYYKFKMLIKWDYSAWLPVQHSFWQTVSFSSTIQLLYKILPPASPPVWPSPHNQLFIFWSALMTDSLDILLKTLCPGFPWFPSGFLGWDFCSRSLSYWVSSIRPPRNTS